MNILGLSCCHMDLHKDPSVFSPAFFSPEMQELSAFTAVIASPSLTACEEPYLSLKRKLFGEAVKC